ncbi:unnamed protein product [Prorocentrum cordatum]|uniref:Ion transport domain-containing protein n=1 Tax=Prorocentrum cordatum TaxID=2364126 RepID=A0ABN9W5G7_9DINO|nr:unnamed protein product [Polarella glacialis]
MVEAGLRGHSGSRRIPIFDTPRAARMYLLHRRLLPHRQAVLACYIALGFVEQPPYCAEDEELCPGGAPRGELAAWPLAVLPRAASLLAALVLLAALLGDCGLMFASLPRAVGAEDASSGSDGEAPAGRAGPSRRAPRGQRAWVALSSSLVGCSLAEVAARMVGVGGLPPRLQLYRVLRPAVWATRYLYCSVGVFLAISTWVATVLFADFADKFVKYENTLLQLFILMTTSNYPDIQTPLVNEWWPSFLFFCGFLCFGLFVLMNLVLSDIYTAYYGILQRRVVNSLLRKERALQGAFDVLSSLGAARSPAAGASFVSAAAWSAFYDEWAPGAIRDRDPHSRGLGIFGCVQASSATPEGLSRDEFCALVLTLGNKHQRFLERRELLISHFFTLLWATEMCVRVFGKGGLRYCWNRGAPAVHRGELVLIAMVTLAEGVTLARPSEGFSHSFWKMRTLLRMASTLRVFGRRESVQAFLQSLVRLLPAASLVLNAMLAVHLLFAEIGLQLFGGLLRQSNASLQHTQWAALRYWSNNFNSLASSAMVLFEQLVVNNWYVVMDAAAAALGEWTRAYFVCHYIVGVTVAANVFVAFLLNARQARQAGAHQDAVAEPSSGRCSRGGQSGSGSDGEGSSRGRRRPRAPTSDNAWANARQSVVHDMFSEQIEQVLASGAGAQAAPRLTAAWLNPRGYIKDPETPGLASALKRRFSPKASPRPPPPQGPLEQGSPQESPGAGPPQVRFAADVAGSSSE